MKLYPSEDIRNFAIAAHASSGKMMLAESMEADASVINRLGSIELGTTMSDYHDAEKERQISIKATPLCVEFGGKKLIFFDAAGYLDFMAEALGAMQHVWSSTGERRRSGHLKSLRLITRTRCAACGGDERVG